MIIVLLGFGSGGHGFGSALALGALVLVASLVFISYITRSVTVDFSGWFYHFTMVLLETNSCINPFIYAAKYREFQHGVRRMVAKTESESAPI